MDRAAEVRGLASLLSAFAASKHVRSTSIRTSITSTTAALLAALALDGGAEARLLAGAQYAAQLLRLSRAVAQGEAGAEDLQAERSAATQYALRPRPQKRRRLEEELEPPAALQAALAEQAAASSRAAARMAELARLGLEQLVLTAGSRAVLGCSSGGSKQQLWDSLMVELLPLLLLTGAQQEMLPITLLHCLHQLTLGPSVVCTGAQRQALLALAQQGSELNLGVRCLAALLYARLAAAAKQSGAPMCGTDDASAMAAVSSLAALLLQPGIPLQPAAWLAEALHTLGEAYPTAVALRNLQPYLLQLIPQLAALVQACYSSAAAALADDDEAHREPHSWGPILLLAGLVRHAAGYAQLLQQNHGYSMFILHQQRTGALQALLRGLVLALAEGSGDESSSSRIVPVYCLLAEDMATSLAGLSNWAEMEQVPPAQVSDRSRITRHACLAVRVACAAAHGWLHAWTAAAGCIGCDRCA
jgi:hypothetical protein